MYKRFKRVFSLLFQMDNINIDCLPFYSAAKNTLMLGFFGHVAFMLLFIWLGIELLVFANFAGLVCCICCIIMNNKGRFVTSVVLSTANVIVNTALAVILLGWNCGFQLYLLFTVAVLFFCPPLNIKAKGLYSALLCLIFLGLGLLTDSILPFVPLSKSVQAFIENLNILILFSTIITMSYSYSKYANLSVEKLRVTYSSLKKLASTDPLTSLPNRRAMSNLLDTEINRFTRNKKTFVLILCDIDNFKAINDCYGHDCGDYVLTELSSLMSSHLRRQDIVARWGGEEFLILLPESDLKAGQIVAEKLRNEISNTTFHYEGNNIKITMTFGISLYDHVEETKDVIRRADMALYAGKSNGKNRIAFF
jgi:diguanylate cyclase (GGDEF)-like protein